MVYFLCKAYDSGQQNCCFALSLPVRGAWVEIIKKPLVRYVNNVAPRAGSVG